MRLIVSRVTNRIDVEAARPLLETARQAVLAHVDLHGHVQAMPVAFRWRDGRFQVGLEGRAIPSGTRVALAVDDGWYWWDLRAVLARGVVTSVVSPADPAAPALAWFELAPDRVTAWDYNTFHEEP
jgi:hypothetical protein